MRILHTADWHLGQSLHGHDRGAEHDAFLSWLLDQVRRDEPHVVVIAGDVFDSSSPTSDAMARYYRFLADCRRVHPDGQIVVVGGNHDSPHRLDAPVELLAPMRIHVVGSPGHDPERLIVPIGPQGAPVGYLLAVPYLRPSDLGRVTAEAGDRFIEGHRAFFQRVLDALPANATQELPLVATAHCFMAGGQQSEESERPIQRGNQSLLPLDVIPKRVDYLALGHLHRAQRVSGAVHARYPGSPIPLSMTERDYAHQVLRVDLEAGAPAKVKSLHVPRAASMLAVPEVPAAPDAVIEALSALEVPDDPVPPYLEVRVRLTEAAPRLRQRIEEVLHDKRVRLTRIRVERTERATGVAPHAEPLQDLAPVQVFRELVAQARGAPPSRELESLFHRVVEEAEDEP